jgi:hypothetical protein
VIQQWFFPIGPLIVTTKENQSFLRKTDLLSHATMQERNIKSDNCIFAGITPRSQGNGRCMHPYQESRKLF